MSEKNILRDGCEAFHISLNKEQEEQFLKYYEILIEWNKVMNLTAITDYDEVMLKHFVDSISLSNTFNLSSVNCMIDIGTGAGFPGIPLKIIYPHLKVVLLDSLNKRIRFLNEVVDNLGLKDISAVHGRAENFAKQKDYRENFDLCVSRAVANLSSLSEYCLPYVRTGGMFVSYKAGNVEEEAEQAKKAIFLLGGEKKEIVKFRLPESEIERSLVMIKKVKNTPAKYPRKAGLPAKEPLS